VKNYSLAVMPIIVSQLPLYAALFIKELEVIFFVLFLLLVFLVFKLEKFQKIIYFSDARKMQVAQYCALGVSCVSYIVLRYSGCSAGVISDACNEVVYFWMCSLIFICVYCIYIYMRLEPEK
jgi:hypothetical protein